MGYLTISTNVDAIKHITDDNFCLSARQRTGALYVQQIQLLHLSRLIQHLSEKCDFHVSPFLQVVQKHKLFEVAQ